MKALSLTQPWLWSILNAGKRVENRSNKRGMPPMCRHRGPLLLHAAGGMKMTDYDAAVAFMVERRLARPKIHSSQDLPDDLPIIPPRLQDVGDDMLPRGVIMARCDVVGHIEPQLYQGAVRPMFVASDPQAVSRGLNMRWWMGGYALILADVRPTPWVPCRGMLGLWTPPPEVLAKLGVAT